MSVEDKKKLDEEKVEKKKKDMEKRRMEHYVLGFGAEQQHHGARDNRVRAKLAAKLAQRKKTQNTVNHEEAEKEALRAQLLREARQAQIEMEERRAERIILEERLRIFQEKLERELTEAAEYAAARFMEREEKREREEKERLMRLAMVESEKKKKKEIKEEEKENGLEAVVQEIKENQEEKKKISATDFKNAVYARLAVYERARFEYLKVLQMQHQERQKQLEAAQQEKDAEDRKRKEEEEKAMALREQNKKIVQDYLQNIPYEVKLEEDVSSEMVDNACNARREMKQKQPARRDTSAERALKEKVLRKLKMKLEKRMMNRHQEKQEIDDLKHPNEIHEYEDEERRSWDREDRMRHVQYMRGGYRKDF